jgi:glycosyltransferase involved in cell wall biosynthesis
VEIKKHILFIVENAPVPTDIRVWSEAKSAKKLGYEVSIISPKRDIAFGKYQKLDGIDIYRHGEPKYTGGILGFIFEFINALFWEFILSVRIYREKPFQIIHAANPPDNIFIIALFYKLLSVKFIFDHHDLSPELYLTRFKPQKNIIYKVLYLCEKLSCKFANVIVSTNNSYKKLVVKRHKLDPEKVIIVRNDPMVVKNGLHSNSTQKYSNGLQKLLFLGSINPQDGIDILIKALDYLVNNLNVKNFVCNVVGRGDSLPFAKQMAKELNLEKYVDFKGFINERDKIREFLNSADICLEPAPYNEINRHSTFIKVMEYMSAGKPIVAFDLCETRYSTNNFALLVKRGDIFGFSNAIKKLIDDPSLREKLGEKGRKRIKDDLNWEYSALNLEKAYRSIN